ncbi:hypothetical protein [Kiloniella sp.]|uniref:hypothetical protein n=1 Tax=Kiloniella sp. TaxID=1938587 RepID=UPI003B025A8F
MINIKQFLIFSLISIALFGCQTNGDLIRPAFFTVTYSKGDALLAANGSPIKINVLISDNNKNFETRVSEGMNKYGPKWLNARYVPISQIENQNPYQMKWAFNVTEDGHAPGLCRKKPTDLKQNTPSTGVVLAAFCLRGKTLSAVRARVTSLPDSEEFLQTIGNMGRELLVIQNPVRDSDCWVISDCG